MRGKRVPCLSPLWATASSEQQALMAAWSVQSFVAPDAQSRGVGKLLMAEIEKAARERGIPTLVVPSSVTAETFYARLGFKALRSAYHGDERTIIMERPLDGPL